MYDAYRRFVNEKFNEFNNLCNNNNSNNKLVILDLKLNH